MQSRIDAQARRALRQRAWVAGLLALLAACGGGGGGGGGGGDTGGGTAGVLTADIYAVATGDRRTWPTGVAGGALRSERVGASTTVPAGTALAVRSEDGSIEYLQRTASAVLPVPGPASDALTAAAGPIELLRFGLSAGQTVVTYDRTLAVDLDADGRADIVVTGSVLSGRPFTGGWPLRAAQNTQTALTAPTAEPAAEPARTAARPGLRALRTLKAGAAAHQ